MADPRSKAHPLRGTYTTPTLRRGDRVECLVRDCTVIVTSWSDAPISWPRGRILSAGAGGPGGLIVTEELARALSQESAQAFSYWWGIGHSTVTKWRVTLGITRKSNPGTMQLVQAATAVAREESYKDGVSEDVRKIRRQTVLRIKMWKLSSINSDGVEWLPEHVALLGTMPDSEVAAKTGHTADAARRKRGDLHIPVFRSRRYKANR